jgi:hypothetical protein
MRRRITNAPATPPIISEVFVFPPDWVSVGVGDVEVVVLPVFDGGACDRVELGPRVGAGVDELPVAEEGAGLGPGVSVAVARQALEPKCVAVRSR